MFEFRYSVKLFSVWSSVSSSILNVSSLYLFQYELGPLSQGCFKVIRAMWANHFEALGTLSEIVTFDKGFFTKVTDSVREMSSTFVNDPNGILCEPLEYEEVARVCSTLELGVSDVEIDYEHIRYARPPLWKLLFQLYQNYFDNFSSATLF